MDATDVRLTLRLPRGLYETARLAAGHERRSLHGQLLWYVQCSIEAQEHRQSGYACIQRIAESQTTAGDTSA